MSNAITRLHREHYGRGATTSRTVIQRNYVIVFLEDIYTPVERTLIEAGRHDAVRDTRQVFQQAMGPAFSAAIEEISGRKVIAFMSQVCFAPDMAAEVFVLEPRDQDRAPEEVSPELEPVSVDGKPHSLDGKPQLAT
jgi:uncharacterized protein YbcI